MRDLTKEEIAVANKLSEALGLYVFMPDVSPDEMKMFEWLVRMTQNMVMSRPAAEEAEKST